MITPEGTCQKKKQKQKKQKKEKKKKEEQKQTAIVCAKPTGAILHKTFYSSYLIGPNTAGCILMQKMSNVNTVF